MTIKNNRVICECACQSPNHLLVFTQWYDFDETVYPVGNVIGDIDNSINVQFTSDWNANFWNRFKRGIKYIFKKQKYPIGDEVMFTMENVEHLEKAIKLMRKKTYVSSKSQLL
jgi:hypothetical protein